MTPDIHNLGKILIIIGTAILVLGILITAGNKIPWLGKLPGDIFIKKENFSFYFPIVTSIIISLLLSLIFYLSRK